MPLENVQPIQDHLWDDVGVSLTYFAVTALVVLAVDVLRKWLYQKIDDAHNDDEEESEGEDDE